MEDKMVVPVERAAAEIMSADYFLAHWQQILPRYIGNGRPSRDTMENYVSYIRQFLSWCAATSVRPLSATDYEMRGFLEWLYRQGYKDDTIAVKLVAIRRLFSAAERLGVASENPCGEIRVPNAAPDELVRFFAPEQLFAICEEFGKDENIFRRKRNTAIVYFMGVEGLRTVEIHRMNWEDVDEGLSSILIHGKGHDRRIFPCPETMQKLRSYLAECPARVARDGPFTPVFLSDCHANRRGRLSRTGIRYIIDAALVAAGLKRRGVSCHALRHSAGTNLYAATKDLRLVQETLGHRDPKTTARYAHVQDRLNNRRTSAIVPREGTEKPPP